MEWCGLIGNICQLLNICRTTTRSLHSMKTSRYRDVTVFFVFLKHGEVVAGVSPHLSCLSRMDDLGHFAHRTLAFPHFNIKYAVHGSNFKGKSIIETLNYLAVGTRCGLSSASPGEIFYKGVECVGNFNSTQDIWFREHGLGEERHPYESALHLHAFNCFIIKGFSIVPATSRRSETTLANKRWRRPRSAFSVRGLTHIDNVIHQFRQLAMLHV